jgi:hypothetical protein
MKTMDRRIYFAVYGIANPRRLRLALELVKGTPPAARNRPTNAG